MIAESALAAGSSDPETSGDISEYSGDDETVTTSVTWSEPEINDCPCVDCTTLDTLDMDVSKLSTTECAERELSTTDDAIRVWDGPVVLGGSGETYDWLSDTKGEGSVLSEEPTSTSLPNTLVMPTVSCVAAGLPISAELNTLSLDTTACKVLVGEGTKLVFMLSTVSVLTTGENKADSVEARSVRVSKEAGNPVYRGEWILLGKAVDEVPSETTVTCSLEPTVPEGYTVSNDDLLVSETASDGRSEGNGVLSSALNCMVTCVDSILRLLCSVSLAVPYSDVKLTLGTTEALSLETGEWVVSDS